MNKDTIIKVLLAIIALMVFAWLWRTISGMLIGTLVLTTSLLSVLIALIILKLYFRLLLLCLP